MTVAWIGTGVMGAPMASHLLAAGHELRVFTRSRARAETLLAAGAVWAASPAAAAREADVVCTMVGHPADVEQVYLAADGVLAACDDKRTRVLIDFTTSTPSLAQRLAVAAKSCQATALDAPVSGGDVGARAATLVIMVGGDTATFEEQLPLLRLLGKNIERMGGPGCGQHAKMCNQILIAGTMVGLCESLLYAASAGLDRDQLVALLSRGAAASWSLERLAPRILKGDFAPGFLVEHFIKDLGIALDEARRFNLQLPGLALARQLYEETRALGHGRDGTQALLLALAARQNPEP